MGQYKRHFPQITCHDHRFSIWQSQKIVQLLRFNPVNWGGPVSSSMALWLWVIWGTATDQLCLIVIFYHTESRITFSTHKTHQVQSTSEQEMLDSCCYSFSERETGWEESMRLGGSFTATASYFPLRFLQVNLRVHKVHRIPKLCHFPIITVSCAVIAINIHFSWCVNC